MTIFFSEMLLNQCVHPYALKAFQEYKVCNWKPYSFEIS